jgi:hypothetical protein
LSKPKISQKWNIWQVMYIKNNLIVNLFQAYLFKLVCLVCISMGMKDST